MRNLRTVQKIEQEKQKIEDRHWKEIAKIYSDSFLDLQKGVKKIPMRPQQIQKMCT